MRTFYEFFAGGGMARAGLGQEWSCLFANDFDHKKTSSYVANWGDQDMVCADVAELTSNDIPEHADLAWASFPCQDLSVAGGGAGLKGGRSGTFWPFWKLMLNLKQQGRAPRLIVLENVIGALTSHQGQDFSAICSALSEAGYRFGAIIANAIDFVPQSRPRLFIIAVDSSITINKNLESGGPIEPWHTKALKGALHKVPKLHHQDWIWWNLPTPPVRQTVLADLIEGDPIGVKWHTKEETRKLLEMMSDLNLQKVRAVQGSGKKKVGTIYKRTRPDGKGGRVQRAEVRFDDVAGCLRTPAGGSSRQLIIVIEGKSIRSRLLSPREASRLMGLPDTYLLPMKYNDAYHLAGDGVAVPVVRFLANQILEPLLDNLCLPNERAA